MEGVEEPFLVGFRNSDPLVADRANNFSLVITPGRFLVDVLPVGRFLVSSTHRGHLKRSASAIPSRVVPRLWVPQRCETMAKNAE